MFSGEIKNDLRIIFMDNKEIDKKIELLKTFIGKMNDLIDEMVIRLSSNEHDIEDINNLFEDMDDLIDSVKDY